MNEFLDEKDVRICQIDSEMKNLEDNIRMKESEY